MDAYLYIISSVVEFQRNMHCILPIGHIESGQKSVLEITTYGAASYLKE